MKSFLQNVSLSKSILILVILILTIAKFIILPHMNMITWDNFGYYLYLPDFFIYHDPHMQKIHEWLYPIIEKYQNTPNLYQLNPVGENFIIKYSMGQAIFYAPFFFIAHVITSFTSYPADGFSLIYQLVVRFGCFLYLIAGLILLRKALLHFLNEKATAITILLLAFGTNLHIYAASISPHETLFFLYALMIYITVKRTDYFSLSFWIKASAITGLACLTRPTDGLIGLIPLLYGMKSFKDIIEHLKLWFTKNSFKLIISLLIFVAIMFIQFLYWKVYTGKWIFDTYETSGESIQLTSPNTIDFLFSFRKGWFIYSPLMFVALFGFIVMYFRKREVFIPVFIFYVINLYLISSWTAWWYSDSFSSRAMVQSLAITIIPLGFLFQYMMEKKTGIKLIFLTLLFLLLSLNIFQTWQFHKSIFPLDRLTRKAYSYIFLKTKIDFDKRESLMLINRNLDETYIPNIERYKKRTIDFCEYEDNLGETMPQQICDTLAYADKRSFRLDSNCIYSNLISLKYSQLTDRPHAWIKASAWVYMPFEFENNLFSLAVHFENRGKNYGYKLAPLDSSKVKPQKWNYIEFLYLTPEIISKNDKLLVYFWLRGNNPIWIDNFRVDMFETID